MHDDIGLGGQSTLARRHEGTTAPLFATGTLAHRDVVALFDQETLHRVADPEVGVLDEHPKTSRPGPRATNFTMCNTRQIKFLIPDRASQFVAAFDTVLRADGATVIRTPVRVPVANSYAERWIGTVRRELLDRTLIWNRRQLEQQLHDYVGHYNQHRPHRTLGQRAPNTAEVVAFRNGQPIRRHPTCGGLVNEYRQAA